MKKYLKTNKENVFLKVETYYNKGGINYFSYKTERRGYYLSVSPVERARGFESYIAFSGIKFLIKEVKRQSEKAAKESDALSEKYETALIEKVLQESGLELCEG